MDFGDAVRSVFRNPTFAVLSVACLAVGIGANTTVFTFVNALLLRPLPLATPGELVTLRNVRLDNPQHTRAASYQDFLQWRDSASAVAAVVAQRTQDARVSDGGEPQRVRRALVSWDLFPVLGVQPALGRGFFEREDRAGGDPVALLSHALWQQRYASDPAVIGRSVTVDGTARVIVGVMPATLSHIALRGSFGAQLWTPIGQSGLAGPGDRWEVQVVGRLRSGVPLEAAAARLGVVSRALEGTGGKEGWGIAIEPLRVGFSANTRAMLLLLMGAVICVLLIACANVANLTLARTNGRRHELAIRLALGASRARVARDVLAESLIVAAMSLPPGIAIAYGGRNLLLGRRASPELYANVPIDTQVLAFTIAVAILACIVFGLVPALHLIRRLRYNLLEPGGGRQATAGPRHARLSRVLIVVEIALSLILLVGASLFVQSFRNAFAARGTFDTSSILTAAVEVDEDGAEPSDRSMARVVAIVDRLAALPGVTAVAAANLMPLRDGGARATVRADVPQGASLKPRAALLGGITSDFFDVLNVPILKGRGFTDGEGRSRLPVAIVNKTMAQRLWADESPIARQVRVEGAEPAWFTVIGVSDDILTWDLSDRPQPSVYVPYAHSPTREPGFFVRTSGDPTLVAQPARAAIHAVDPTLPIGDLMTMTDVHYLALSRMQTLASLLTLLGVIALLLGSTGVYGVLSYFVSQRTQEIGIRAALGADSRRLVRLFVRQGMTVALLGIVLGLPGAWMLARVAGGRLHEVDPGDPVTFTGVTLLLAAVAFLATYIPARRAAAVDPLVAIRG